MKRFTANGAKVDLSLSNVHGIVLGEKVSNQRPSDMRAKATIDVLTKLLDGKPTYSNFHSEFVHPLQSKLMKKLCNFKSIRERLNLFLPLQQYISRELNVQHVELITTGVYAPTEDDTSLTDPQKVATAMCRMLVHAGFNFDELIELYNEKGLAEVELTLRTVFLDKMNGQPRAVVDQTIRATRLVVSFFRTNGHLPLDDLLERASQMQSVIANSQEGNMQSRDDPRSSMSQSPPPAILNVDLPKPTTSVKLPGIAPVPSSGPQDTATGNSEETDNVQEEYMMKMQEYKELAEFLKRRLLKRVEKMALHVMTESSTEIKIHIDMLLNVLIDAKIKHSNLLDMYAQDKKLYKNRSNFRNGLILSLKNIFEKRGITLIKLHQFIDYLVDYCGEAHFKATSEASTGESPKADSTDESGKALETVRLALDKNISDFKSSNFMLDFKNRMFSLVAIKLFFVKKLEPIIAACGGNVQQVSLIGEHVQKLIAFLGYNHFRMKQLYDQSDSALVDDVRHKLSRNMSLLPPGMDLDSLLDYLLEYFKEQSEKKNAKKQLGKTPPSKMVFKP